MTQFSQSEKSETETVRQILSVDDKMRYVREQLKNVFSMVNQITNETADMRRRKVRKNKRADQSVSQLLTRNIETLLSGNISVYADSPNLSKSSLPEKVSQSNQSISSIRDKISSKTVLNRNRKRKRLRKANSQPEHKDNSHIEISNGIDLVSRSIALRLSNEGNQQQQQQQFELNRDQSRQIEAEEYDMRSATSKKVEEQEGREMGETEFTSRNKFSTPSKREHSSCDITFELKETISMLQNKISPYGVVCEPVKRVGDSLASLAQLLTSEESKVNSGGPEDALAYSIRTWRDTELSKVQTDDDPAKSSTTLTGMNYRKLVDLSSDTPTTLSKNRVTTKKRGLKKEPTESSFLLFAEYVTKISDKLAQSELVHLNKIADVIKSFVDSTSVARKREMVEQFEKLWEEEVAHYISRVNQS